MMSEIEEKARIFTEKALTPISGHVISFNMTKRKPLERRKGWIEKTVSFKKVQFTKLEKIAAKNQESFPDVVRRGADKVIEEESV
jgi:hypothetical protein